MTTKHQKKFSANRPPQGLGFARFMMVLASFAPLFLLWAIRGNHLVPRAYFVPACLLMAVLPNLFLVRRWQTAKRTQDLKPITVGQAEDHRDHILVYLFSMLLPFYSESLEDLPSLLATLAALAFIIFLFWHLNLHYMNCCLPSWAIGYLQSIRQKTTTRSQEGLALSCLPAARCSLPKRASPPIA